MNKKEDIYQQLREKEGWRVDDLVLQQFPQIPPGIPQEATWRFRMQSLHRFQRYLEKHLRKGSRILDLESGNKWISTALSRQGYIVIGLEPGIDDYLQANRVFGKNPRLSWHHGPLDSLGENHEFDLILLAASLQYFPSLTQVDQQLAPRLRASGSIHILDSKLYPPHQLAAARERSRQYYQAVGFPEMADYYFHHSIEEAKSLGYKRRWPPWPWSSIRQGLTWWYRKI